MIAIYSRDLEMQKLNRHTKLSYLIVDELGEPSRCRRGAAAKGSTPAKSNHNSEPNSLATNK